MTDDRLKIAVVGAGNLPFAPTVFATLAHWNAELPVDIWLWDGDAEMLDIFFMLAQTCFFATQSSHRLYPTLDPTEALEHASAVISCIGTRGAKKFVGEGEGAVGATCRRLELLIPDGAAIAAVSPGQFELADNVTLPAAGETVPDALRILRYINGEDSIWDLLNPNETNPLRNWLNENAVNRA